MMLQHCGLPEDGFFVTQMCLTGVVQCKATVPRPHQAVSTSFLFWGKARPEPCPQLPGALHSDLKDRQLLCHQPPGLPTATLHPGQQLPTPIPTFNLTPTVLSYLPTTRSVHSSLTRLTPC